MTNDTMTLLHGDCLERMSDIPDGMVDMVMTDLPYGTTACQWDSVIPFEPLWAHYKRVTKPNAAIVLTASQPFTAALVMSNPAMFKYEWIWKKNRPTGFAHAKNKPLKSHENALVFSTGTTVHESQSKERMPYFPQGTRDCGEARTYKKGKGTNTCFAPRESHKDEYTQQTTGYPDSVVEFNTDMLGIHPTAKPVALMEYLIRTYTTEGETVLDSCMGSGTTGVACHRANRRFIGIERDDHYFAVATKRIEDEMAQILMFR